MSKFGLRKFVDTNFNKTEVASLRFSKCLVTVTCDPDVRDPRSVTPF